MSLILETETRILQYKGQRRHARQQWIGRSTPGAEQGPLAKRTLKQIGGHECRRCQTTRVGCRTALEWHEQYS